MEIDKSRPILPGRGGKGATEESITVTHPSLNGGRPTNIPSIWGGQRPPGMFGTPQFEDWAVAQALKAGTSFPAFNSIEEAVRAAQMRSDEIGRVRMEELDRAMQPPSQSPWEFE
jgi:hypothetical protein